MPVRSLPVHGHTKRCQGQHESIGRLTSAVEGGRAQIARIDEAVADTVDGRPSGRDVEPALALAETETAETDTQGAIERLEADVDRRSARQREITLAERGASRARSWQSGRARGCGPDRGGPARR